MGAIILIALQILYMVIKAYFAKDSDEQLALARTQEAQEKLDHVAENFESGLRYGSPPTEQVDHIQDALDGEQKSNRP